MRLLFIATVLLWQGADACAADVLVDKLRMEWSALKAMDDRDISFQIDREVQFGKHKSSNRYEVMLSGGCGKLQSSKSVLCWNSQYAFNLKRPKGSLEADWLLGELVVAEPSKNKLKDFFFANGFDGYLFKPLTAFYGSTCESYLASESMQVIDHASDGPLVRANFTLKASFADDSSNAPERFQGVMVAVLSLLDLGIPEIVRNGLLKGHGCR